MLFWWQLHILGMNLFFIPSLNDYNFFNNGDICKLQKENVGTFKLQIVETGII
jgi:hypothetical protein